MKFFSLSIVGWVTRLYFMMMVVIAAGFTGQWWLALFALPIFLSAMTGIAFKK